MKIFLSNTITERTNFSSKLSNLGIQIADSYNDPSCTGYITMMEPDFLDFNNIEDLQNYVEVHGGHVPSFLSSKINGVNENLCDKWLLHKALQDTGKATIPTIFPTSLEEIQNFFNEHPVVFCKPRIGSGAKKPGAHKINLGIKTNQDTDINIVNYIETIPFPTRFDIYYRKFTSYDNFIENIDIENFIDIQTNNKSLKIHKVILQSAVESFNPIFYTGWINGNGNIYMEPKSDNFSNSFPPNPVNNSRIGATNESLHSAVNSSDFGQDYGRLTPLNDPNNYFDYINTVFQTNNVKNTPFAAQLVRYNNQLVMTDYTSRAEKLMSNAWSDINLVKNRIEYVQDVTPNMIEDTNYMYYFVCNIFAGFNLATKNLMNKYSIELNVPVPQGSKKVGLRAYSTNLTELQNNLKNFLTELNN